MIFKTRAKSRIILRVTYFLVLHNLYIDFIFSHWHTDSQNTKKFVVKEHVVHIFEIIIIIVKLEMYSWLWVARLVPCQNLMTASISTSVIHWLCRFNSASKSINQILLLVCLYQGSASESSGDTKNFTAERAGHGLCTCCSCWFWHWSHEIKCHGVWERSATNLIWGTHVRSGKH